MVLDRTVIVLPDELASVWRGGGGSPQERTQAAVKLQVSLDRHTGSLRGPELYEGGSQGSPSPLQQVALRPGTVRATHGSEAMFGWTCLLRTRSREGISSRAWRLPPPSSLASNTGSPC